MNQCEGQQSRVGNQTSTKRSQLQPIALCRQARGNVSHSVGFIHSMTCADKALRSVSQETEVEQHFHQRSGDRICSRGATRKLSNGVVFLRRLRRVYKKGATAPDRSVSILFRATCAALSLRWDPGDHTSSNKTARLLGYYYLQPKLEAHLRSCRGSRLTCIDCNRTFDQGGAKVGQCLVLRECFCWNCRF